MKKKTAYIRTIPRLGFYASNTSLEANGERANYFSKSKKWEKDCLNGWWKNLNALTQQLEKSGHKVVNETL